MPGAARSREARSLPASLLSSALVALALLASGAAPADARPRANPLDPQRFGRQPVAIRDRIIDARFPALKPAQPRIPEGGLEGRYPVGDGNTVRVVISETYEPDPTVAQSVASYLGTLIHGGEINGVTVFLGSPQDIALACGQETEACFNSAVNTMIVPAAVPSSGIPQEEIVAHEYGHALANGRSNQPFPAVLFGTKRWASYEQVCPRFLRTLADPQAQVPYGDIPGEAFADSYRILNGGSPGLFRFNRLYFPNATDLRLIREDALNPWHMRPAYVRDGSFSPGRPDVRRLGIATPLDGTLRIHLLSAPGTNYDMELRGPILRQPIAEGRRPGRIDQIASLVCGSRALQLTVRRKSGFGPYRLTISKP